MVHKAGENGQFNPFRKDSILWGASVTDQDIASSASFRILCLEGSLTSFTSPSSGGSPGPV